MNKPYISAFPVEGEGRLLRSRSISRLILPFTSVPACTFSVYASQWVLPPTHARLDTWPLARLYHGGHLRPLNSLRFKAQPSLTPSCRFPAAGSSSGLTELESVVKQLESGDLDAVCCARMV